MTTTLSIVTMDKKKERYLFAYPIIKLLEISVCWQKGICLVYNNVICQCSMYHLHHLISTRIYRAVFMCSQDNINVDEAARFLVENILANDKGLPYEENNGDRIKLDQETVAAESKSGCC